MSQSHVKLTRDCGPTSLPSLPTTTLEHTPPPPPTPPLTPSIHVEANGADDHEESLKMERTTEPPHQEHTSSLSPNPNPHHHQHTSSVDSHRSRQEYMDSLVPPSDEEMSRIAHIQLQREQEEKRKAREREKEEKRGSLDVSPPPSTLDVQHDQASKGRPRHSSILGGLRHHKSNSSTRDATHSRTSSVAAAAIKSAQQAAAASHDDAQADGDHILSHRAATLIQRTYRGYKTRREMKGLGLDADTRWTHALKELRFREATRPRSGREEEEDVSAGEVTDGGNDAKARRRSHAARGKWKKVAVIASRAAADMDDDPTCSSDSDSDPSDSRGPSDPEKRKLAHQKREEAKARRRKDARMMGLQYFLEMVDLKHRYGSNLRTYHGEWKKADTKEPFFYWLDYGEGKDVEVAACPRERLDREQVRYLSREERQYYLVKVDAEGRLCWSKNGARIDTTEMWKDSIHGIVPADDPTPAFQPTSTDPNRPNLAPSDSSPFPSSSGSLPSPASESEREADRAAKYASPGSTDAKGYKKVTHLSASTIFNKLLRKSVRKNTWIFVADTSFRLYVGIKDSGAFQHSSFVQGSRISSAGLIKIKNGRLASLSPLSGHYRPPTSNFRAFVRSLKEEGVDMGHVSISKSYAVLVGLEMYMKTRAKGKSLLERAGHKKDKVLHPEVAQKREEEERDKSQSAEKERKLLEKQRQEEEQKREENRSTVRVLQKLKMTPAVPAGQKGEAANGVVLSERRGEEEAAEAAGGLARGAADENGSCKGKTGKTTHDGS